MVGLTPGYSRPHPGLFGGYLELLLFTIDVQPRTFSPRTVSCSRPAVIRRRNLFGSRVLIAGSAPGNRASRTWPAGIAAFQARWVSPSSAAAVKPSGGELHEHDADVMVG